MSEPVVDFAIDPSRYRHWSLDVDGPVATVTMAVDPEGGLRDDYDLKTNSYDLGVDVELHDLVQRLRFEHPGVKAVVVTGGLDKIFCAGANIQMLAGASHGHKVNFCKFTNETRNSIEDASANSGPEPRAPTSATNDVACTPNSPSSSAAWGSRSTHGEIQVPEPIEPKPAHSRPCAMRYRWRRSASGTDASKTTHLRSQSRRAAANP